MRNLKCFQIVYEEKNLQVAAGKLFLSPQGLSKIIKSLEEECGMPLFVRSKDGFMPTEAGKIYYEKSHEILKDINEMFFSIGSLVKREKHFRIGFSAGVIRTIDIPAVNRFMKANPEIVANWDEQDNEIVLEQVLNGVIDCGLVVGRPNVQGLICQLIKSVEIVLYVYKGHKFWDREQINIIDLTDEPIVSMNRKYHIYQNLMNACHMKDFHPNIVARVVDGATIYSLVRNGIGVGISPKLFPKDDNIRAIPITDAYSWDLYGVYLENSPDAEMAKRFINVTLGE
ncbi:LysR family transcriptional regulator [Pseudobutyrivibrio xylanivorans]|nr:LysR family transcriptional regulator [Pseudobutyrivibrio xylanivorans]